MEINALPKYDQSDNPTGCCPRFNSDGWDGQLIHLKDKLFMRAKTKSIMHIPLNMGAIFADSFAAIEKAGAQDVDEFLVLSHELSPWKAEHLFAVSKDVPDHEMVRVSGDYVTAVFEGPFKEAGNWDKEMQNLAASKGREAQEVSFFYTTCPKCAKTYGKNYVVGFVKLGAKAV